MLASTGVAGAPESFFRAPDRESWAARWGIGRDDGTFDDADDVAAALAAGRTDNGVFAARVMWGTLQELTATLRVIHDVPDAADLDVLTRAFGRTRFVHVRRIDVVAQAVSWSKAEQTDRWVETTDAAMMPPPDVRFDRDVVDELCRTIRLSDDGAEIRIRHRRLADETSTEWIARYRRGRDGTDGHR
jgi:LPS sulfotransferase NodH